VPRRPKGCLSVRWYRRGGPVAASHEVPQYLRSMTCPRGSRCPCPGRSCRSAAGGGLACWQFFWEVRTLHRSMPPCLEGPRPGGCARGLPAEMIRWCALRITAFPGLVPRPRLAQTLALPGEVRADPCASALHVAGAATRVALHRREHVPHVCRGGVKVFLGVAPIFVWHRGTVRSPGSLRPRALAMVVAGQDPYGWVCGGSA
jgi:hypothetical protein